MENVGRLGVGRTGGMGKAARFGVIEGGGMVEAACLRAARAGGMENVVLFGVGRAGGMGYVPHVCRSNLRILVRCPSLLDHTPPKGSS